MTIPRRHSCAAVIGWLAPALALAPGLALPASAQDRPPMEFAGAQFDVTGAGRLDLGEVDAVLRPYLRNFRKGAERLDLTLTIDPAGAVTDCRSAGSSKVSAAGAALCAHARAAGRFEQFPQLALDYTQATYRLSVRTTRVTPVADQSPFEVETAYPLEGTAIRFGAYAIPPAAERLRGADLQAIPMDYPQSALRSGIEAQVVVAITFDTAGAVQSCRPVSSTNTARMAYETCRAARRGFRLLNPPDARPYVWRTTWLIE